MVLVDQEILINKISDRSTLSELIKEKSTIDWRTVQLTRTSDKKKSNKTQLLRYIYYKRAALFRVLQYIAFRCCDTKFSGVLKIISANHSVSDQQVKQTAVLLSSVKVSSFLSLNKLFCVTSRAIVSRKA